MSLKRSFLTVTDQFCGAGGSSIGAKAAGLEIRMAMNHWPLAIETHNTNFPDTDHDCADISAVDPRRYPSTDILITSPECTTHSPAGGNKRRKRTQTDLFVPQEQDPALVRSRATMWDVVRFAEYHEYRAIIVENVVEAVRLWALFPEWWRAMEKLGYIGQIVSLNSMFALPTPQSRDRIYIVWSKRGNRKPDLDIRPRARCAACGDVEARQAWKNGRRVGKYGPRNQYVYSCARCQLPVDPYFFCALNAIDFAIPSQRIGDRKVPLKPRTFERVRYGLGKFGHRYLVITANHTNHARSQVRGIDRAIFAQTTKGSTALISPWIVRTGNRDGKNVSPGIGPQPAQTTAEDLAVAGPMIVNTGSNALETRGGDGMMPTMTGGERAGVVSPFLVPLRTRGKASGMADPCRTVCAGAQHQALISGAAMLRLMGDFAVRGLSAPLPSQTTEGPQDAILSRAPFLVQYYGTDNASSADEPVPTATTKDRHALLTPGDAEVEDCYFRMLAPHEIGAAMAFPETYVVLGKKGERVKQYGNAVTPPAMTILVERIVESLCPERARGSVA